MGFLQLEDYSPELWMCLCVISTTLTPRTDWLVHHWLFIKGLPSTSVLTDYKVIAERPQHFCKMLFQAWRDHGQRSINSINNCL